MFSLVPTAHRALAPSERNVNAAQGACPHLVPEHKTQGNGTKWCCVRTLSNRQVTMCIFLHFARSKAILKSEFSRECWAVDFLPTNRKHVPNAYSGTGTVTEFLSEYLFTYNCPACEYHSLAPCLGTQWDYNSKLFSCIRLSSILY